jgi:hypothetical protein
VEKHFLRRTQKFLRRSLLLAVSMPKSPPPKDKIGDWNFRSTCIKDKYTPKSIFMAHLYQDKHTSNSHFAIFALFFS